MIQFAYPLALVSLLSIPLILLLHLLRPRRRRVILPTTALWQEALEDRSRGLGIRKLLRSISLILLLLIALVLGLALAGPQWLADTAERADTVLVLDVSASMQTRSGGGTRFDQALAEAYRVLDGLPREGRMLVMTSGRKALLKTGFETDRGVLRRALSQLRPGDEAGRPREALALALSLLKGREHGRIYFLTDGAFDADVDARLPQVTFRIVGAPARNVAITRFDLRQELSGEDRYQVLLTVQNYTDAAVVVPASVTLESQTLVNRPIELKAHDHQTLVLRFDGRPVGRATARIEIDDDLAADNQAFATVNAEAPIDVLLFSAGNVYLESVLEALPGINLVKREASAAEEIGQLARLHDIVIFDGVAAPRLPQGNYLLIDTLAPGLPFSAADEVKRPVIAGRGSSALMRDVDLTAVRIEQARRVVVNGNVPGLQRLFWSKETDLALALIAGEVKLVYIGFDLARSNLPLQVAFPVFFSQSLEWLRPRGEGYTATHIEAGAVQPIRVQRGASQVIVRTPSGDSEPLEAKDGAALFEATAAAGIYQYGVGEATRYFAVSLNDARESDVNNRRQPSTQPVDAETAPERAQSLVPLWPYLLTLALALLALEWGVWSWSRRSV